MSAVADGEVKHEIIIVRRGHGDHDEGHHGGVWKIAFADFMTAMMCFFLVMWLINAANEQTKAAVASYFNPVKLIDRNASKKGLEDLGDGPHAAGMADQGAPPTNKGGQDGNGSAGPAEEANASDSVEKQVISDKQLFANPYAVLSEIASETGVMQNLSEKGDGGAQNSGPASGASGGESYRDPFAPDFWSQQVAPTEPVVASQKADDAPTETSTRDDHSTEAKKQADALAEGNTAHRAAEAPPDASPLQTLPEETAKAESAEKSPEVDKAVAEREKLDAEAAKETQVAKKDTLDAAEKSDAEAAKAAAADKREDKKEPSAEAIKAAAEIQKQINEAFRPGEKLAEGLSVVPTEKGVSISVTDQLDFGMFEIGSALPRREMVLAMEKISKILSGRPGKLTIAGHTDGRPFKSENYDNWRLSSARAHSAYYMLVRAGLDEQRVVEVGGYADRKLKEPADPFSAKNRRIEILLAVDG